MKTYLCIFYNLIDDKFDEMLLVSSLSHDELRDMATFQFLKEGLVVVALKHLSDWAVQDLLEEKGFI